MVVNGCGLNGQKPDGHRDSVRDGSLEADGAIGWLHHPRYHGIVVASPYSGDLFMATRARTLRLTVEEAETLEAIAGVDDVSVNEEIRRAITAHIEARRRDADFRKRLEASIERNKEILERLAR